MKFGDGKHIKRLNAYEKEKVDINMTNTRLEQAWNGLKVVILTCAWIMVFAKLNLV